MPHHAARPNASAIRSARPGSPPSLSIRLMEEIADCIDRHDNEGTWLITSLAMSLSEMPS
jgi:hypothetical protein